VRSPDDELEALVAAASGGDEGSWHELWRRLEPRLSRVLRRPRILGPLSRSDDPVHDVLLAVMAKLRDDDFRRLRGYLEARRATPTLTFMRWVIVVAKRAAIDRLRADPEYLDLRTGGERGGAWVETGELRADWNLPAARLPMTNRVAARQILRFAGAALTAPQRRAVEMWSEEASTEDIARDLGLASPDEAERLVRAAVQRLRRHFRQETQ
jgi:DNA-directed RNA polymerase specialized sigma24 family protein